MGSVGNLSKNPPITGAGKSAKDTFFIFRGRRGDPFRTFQVGISPMCEQPEWSLYDEK